MPTTRSQSRKARGRSETSGDAKELTTSRGKRTTKRASPGPTSSRKKVSKKEVSTAEKHDNVEGGGDGSEFEGPGGSGDHGKNLKDQGKKKKVNADGDGDGDGDGDVDVSDVSTNLETTIKGGRKSVSEGDGTGEEEEEAEEDAPKLKKHEKHEAPEEEGGVKEEGDEDGMPERKKVKSESGVSGEKDDTLKAEVKDEKGKEERNLDEVDGKEESEKNTKKPSSQGDNNDDIDIAPGSKSSAIAISPTRETKTERKSTILEMGHIYFFYRPRVSVENPQSLQDVQRSYILLRPLPSGAKFKSDNPEVGEEGSPRALEDAGNNNRLLVVPKKKFPATGSHERLLTFVDKANCSIEEIKETVLKGSNYQTKT